MDKDRFLQLAANRITYRVIRELPKNGHSHSMLVGECYHSDTLYENGYNMNQLVQDGYLEIFQEPFPFQKELVGQNQHTVISVCPECGNHGVNMPLELECGNCGYPKTITYYDAGTIQNYITAHSKQLTENEKNLT